MAAVLGGVWELLASLASVVVWSTSPFNLLEATYAEVNEQVHPRLGVLTTVGVRMGGMSCSSTRAEILGAMMAISVPWPVHVASDSMCMLQRLQTILNGSCNNLRARPWTTTKNGDLLEMCRDLIVWRGGACFTAARWCKGHATVDDVEQSAFHARLRP